MPAGINQQENSIHQGEPPDLFNRYKRGYLSAIVYIKHQDQDKDDSFFILLFQPGGQVKAKNTGKNGHPKKRAARLQDIKEQDPDGHQQKGTYQCAYQPHLEVSWRVQPAKPETQPTHQEHTQGKSGGQ